MEELIQKALSSSNKVSKNSLIEKINRFNENMGIVILTSNINLPKKFHKEINI